MKWLWASIKAFLLVGNSLEEVKRDLEKIEAHQDRMDTELDALHALLLAICPAYRDKA